jgi:tryptophan synthase alpha chain
VSRIAARFRELRDAGSAALIPYITAGDPDPKVTVPLMHRLVKSGADIIELGVPFSDPMADGPVIQRATERALTHRVSLRDVFKMVQQFRAEDAETPVVLMGYLNPVEAMGYETFASEAAQNGVDGVLTVDCPPEEGHELVAALRKNGLDPIFLIAPTSHTQRIARVVEAASGFVYYVSLKGVTGAAHLAFDDVARKLSEIRAATNLPLGVGFGIKDAETAGRMAQIADAVVVGSALVSLIEANAEDPERILQEVGDLLGSMRTAMNAVPA